MVDLVNVLGFLYPDAKPLTHYTVADDGAGAYIKIWDTNVLGAEPTTDILNQTEQSADYQAWLPTQTLEYKQAQEVANNPITQYILSQLALLNPSYTVPDADTITSAVQTSLVAKSQAKPAG